MQVLELQTSLPEIYLVVHKILIFHSLYNFMIYEERVKIDKHRVSYGSELSAPCKPGEAIKFSGDGNC